MALLMYSADLRLRVKDIDFEQSRIMVRDGRGYKDRQTMLPESLKKPLQEHLRKVKAIHEKDLAEGWRVGRKCPTFSTAILQRHC